MGRYTVYRNRNPLYPLYRSIFRFTYDWDGIVFFDYIVSKITKGSKLSLEPRSNVMDINILAIKENELLIHILSAE